MLYIGGDTMVPENSVIAILDLKKSGVYIEGSGEEKHIGEGKPKSLILTEEGGAFMAYYSPVTAASLFRLKNLGGH